MNRIALFWVLLCTASLSASPADDEPVHQALRELKTTMEKALNARDLDTIVANVDPNVVFTTMNGDVVRGPDQIRAYFEKMLGGTNPVVKTVTVAFDVDELTTLYGGDTGVAYGSSKDHYELTGGSTFDIAGRWSCTMVRNGDRWVVASFHYSADIFRNPILDRLRTLFLAGGIAGAVIALLLGIVIGRRMARRPG